MWRGGGGRWVEYSLIYYIGFFVSIHNLLLLFVSWKFGLGLKKVGKITHFGVK